MSPIGGWVCKVLFKSRTKEEQRAPGGISRPVLSVLPLYMALLMTAPMVSAASRFMSAVAWV